MHTKYKRMIRSMEKKERRMHQRRCSEKWFVYILRCKDGTLYTGVTKDLTRRFKMHAEGKASRYTRVRRPVKLLYHEEHSTRSQALVRECAVKSWPKNKKEELVKPKRINQILKKRGRKKCRERDFL